MATDHFHQLLGRMCSRLWERPCWIMVRMSDYWMYGSKWTQMHYRQCIFCSLSVLYWSITRTRL